jgi:hypothetical protein
MNRTILIIALVCLSASVMASKPDKAADDKKDHPQQEVKAALAPDGSPRSATHTQEANDDPPHWYTSLKRPEWWLVAVAILTCIVVGWQAWETRKAAEATERSFDVVIAKERARLVVEFEPLEPWSSERQWTLRLRIVNYGPTKAFVRRAHFLPCIESCNWNPVGVEIHLAMKLPGVIQEGPEGVKADGPIQRGVEIHATCWDIEAETAKAVYAGEAKLFAVGYIDYGDVFENEHRLLFSRVWKPMFVKDGLPTHAEWGNCSLPAPNGEQSIKKRDASDKPENLFVFPPN